MKSLFKILLIGVALWIPVTLQAKLDNNVSKQLRKRYKANRETQLNVINKYGNVILNNWDKDSIAVQVIITAHGKNRETSQKLLDRTDVEFSENGQVISMITELDKSQGWLKDLWNELSEYSKNILSKDQLDVDYEVYLPDYVDLKVQNKFGDVFLPDRKGYTQLALSNGNLKCENLLGSAVIDLSFGEADIASLAKATLYLKSTELDLAYAQDLVLKSNSSKIFIEEVKTLDIASRTDRFRIDQLDRLKGKGSFSKIRVYRISGNVRVDMNYGFLNIDQVASTFNYIRVTGRSTDFDMSFNSNSYFSAKIIAKDGKMNLPTDHNLKLTFTDGREKFVQAAGNLGTIGSRKAELDIDAQGGKVAVSLIPFEPSSQKN